MGVLRNVGKWLGKLMQGLSLHGVIVAICLLWSMPTTGLLISSLRPREDLAQSGWWTVLQGFLTRGPVEWGQFTWDNYIDVATNGRDGAGVFE